MLVISLLLIGGLAGAVWAVLWRSPRVGVYLAIPLAMFSDFAVQQLGEGPTADLVGLVKDAMFLLLLAILALKKRMRFRGQAAHLVGVLLLLAAVAMVFTPNLAQALYGMRNGYVPLLWLIAVPAALNSVHLASLRRAFVWCGEAAAAVALWTSRQGVDWLVEVGILPPGPDEPFPVTYFVSGSSVPRAFSPFVGPNELGVAMLVVLVWILTDQARTPLTRLALAAAPALALLESRSRSAMLGAALVAVYLLASRLPARQIALRKAVMFLGVGLGLAVLAVQLGQSDSLADSSIRGHAASLSEAPAEIVGSPLGHGTGTVGPRAVEFDADALQTESFVLLIALEAGVLAGVVFVLLQLSLVRRVRRSGATSRIVALTVMLGIQVNMLVLPTFQTTPLAWLVWITVGSALVPIAPSLVHAANVAGGHPMRRASTGDLGGGKPAIGQRPMSD